MSLYIFLNGSVRGELAGTSFTFIIAAFCPFCLITVCRFHSLLRIRIRMEIFQDKVGIGFALFFVFNREL